MIAFDQFEFDGAGCTTAAAAAAPEAEINLGRDKLFAIFLAFRFSFFPFPLFASPLSANPCFIL